MHPLLEHLSIFTWMDILESNEKCIAFLEDLKLIPKKTDPAPSCPRCSGPMDVEDAWLKKSILGWKWKCKKRYAWYSNPNPQFDSGYLVDPQYCYAGMNPLDGTFFEDISLPLNDVLAVMFCYILQISFTSIKEHLNCWRIHRNESQISDSTIQNIYSRLDQIILFALSKPGKTFKKCEKINRKTLLEEYAKTLKIEPVFRNFVFQLLMAIKYQYPCIKNEMICESVDIAASTDANRSTNQNFLTKNEFSNGIVLDSSISAASPVLNSCTVSIDNKIVRNVAANNVPNRESAQTTNSEALNSLDVNIDNAIVSRVIANNVPIIENTQTAILETLNSSNVSVDNISLNNVSITVSAQITNSNNLNSAVSVNDTVERNVTESNVLPITADVQIENSIALNSSTVSVENTIVKNEIANNVLNTESVQTTYSEHLNSDVSTDNTILRSVANSVSISADVQNTKSLNYQSISTEKSIFIENENNLKVEDITTFSPDILFPNNIVSLKDNFVSNFSDCVNNDGIVYDDMDIGSVVDVSDVVQTANITTWNAPNCSSTIVADLVTYNQNENNIEIENVNNMNKSSLSDDISFEASDNSICNSPSDRISICGSLSDNSICNSPSDHVSSESSLSDNSICNSPSDHVSIDSSLSDNSICNSPSDHVSIDSSLSDNSMCDSSSNNVMNDGSLSDNFICNSPSNDVIISDSLAVNSFYTSPSDCVIIDGVVFHDDLTMNIDHVEVVNTTNNE